MADKKQWAKSTNGPDWTDVEMMMRSLSALHSGHVGFTVLPRGIGSSGGLSVSCSMMFDVLPGSSLPEHISTESTWPCNSHAELAAHVFAGLHALDFEISKVYKNEVLWK
jgi:hypothetical protein